MLAVRTFMHILSREMLAPVGLPGFVSEYLRLYAFALAFALLVAVGFYIRRLPGWFRSMRAASWPMTRNNRGREGECFFRSGARRIGLFVCRRRRTLFRVFSSAVC